MPAAISAITPAARQAATKTNTPLRDIPQSVRVVTRQQIQDIGAQRIEDVVHYVPGVNWHQGEGNRDQIVIRGQSSTADFFVNGMRDDGQIYRDLYNTERLEFLKGPNALIFGRGGGGGILNRVLKDADGVPINEWMVQTGSFNNKRVSADVGHKITDTVYARINGVIEDTDSYRDYFHNYRYGINPTVTWLADPGHQGAGELRVFPRRADRRSRHSPRMLGAPSRRGRSPSTPTTATPRSSNTASMQSIAMAWSSTTSAMGCRSKARPAIAVTALLSERLSGQRGQSGDRHADAGGLPQQERSPELPEPDRLDLSVRFGP